MNDIRNSQGYALFLCQSRFVEANKTYPSKSRG
uniref:Uncharacterized protein n=1 Tax=Siphoviridae sp. ctcuE16 TaxID=2826397 RepID=A0A8S5QWT3_9CAUD|nr:MAG TPA: hypothetical protein [Siphoviridae sp. ctcuE16]